MAPTTNPTEAHQAQFNASLTITHAILTAHRNAIAATPSHDFHFQGRRNPAGLTAEQALQIRIEALRREEEEPFPEVTILITERLTARVVARSRAGEDVEIVGEESEDEESESEVGEDEARLESADTDSEEDHGERHSRHGQDHEAARGIFSLRDENIPTRGHQSHGPDESAAPPSPPPPSSPPPPPSTPCMPNIHDENDRVRPGRSRTDTLVSTGLGRGRCQSPLRSSAHALPTGIASAMNQGADQMRSASTGQLNARVQNLPLGPASTSEQAYLDIPGGIPYAAAADPDSSYSANAYLTLQQPATAHAEDASSPPPSSPTTFDPVLPRAMVYSGTQHRATTAEAVEFYAQAAPQRHSSVHEEDTTTANDGQSAAPPRSSCWHAASSSTDHDLSRGSAQQSSMTLQTCELRRPLSAPQQVKNGNTRDGTSPPPPFMELPASEYVRRSASALEKRVETSGDDAPRFAGLPASASEALHAPAVSSRRVFLEQINTGMKDVAKVMNFWTGCGEKTKMEEAEAAPEMKAVDAKR